MTRRFFILPLVAGLLAPACLLAQDHAIMTMTTMIMTMTTATTFMTGTTRTIMISMNTKIAPGVFIGSSVIVATLIGTGPLKGSGRTYWNWRHNHSDAVASDKHSLAS